MTIAHRLTATFGAGSELIGGDMNIVADSEQNISVTIADGATDFALGVDWPAGKLQDLFISVSKDCTLEINSSSAPTDTIQLKAGYPLQWTKLSGIREPFAGTAGAITNMYVTVPVTDPVAACDFELRAGVDF